MLLALTEKQQADCKGIFNLSTGQIESIAVSANGFLKSTINLGDSATVWPGEKYGTVPQCCRLSRVRQENGYLVVS